MPKPFPSIIEYEISMEDIKTHVPSHLRTFFQILSTAKGPQLAALAGCCNISVDEKIPKQAFNHPDVRAYCLQLSETPMGFAFFLHRDSTSLPMLAYAVASKVKTIDNSKTGDIMVTANTTDLVNFLSADLSVAEKLFKRAGLGTKAFEECARRISRQCNLKPEDWQ